LAYLLLCIYNQGPLSRFMYLDTYGILKNYKERFSIVLYELINLSLAWQLAFLYNCTFVSELISQNLFFCRFSPDFWRISPIFGEFRLKGENRQRFLPQRSSQRFLKSVIFLLIVIHLYILVYTLLQIDAKKENFELHFLYFVKKIQVLQ